MPVQISGLNNAVKISAGGTSGAALLADGSVRTWGWNLYGQLGDGTNIDQHVPIVPVYLSGVAEISAGGRHVLARLIAPPVCSGDVAPLGGNGTVNIDDLLAVILGWGACP